MIPELNNHQFESQSDEVIFEEAARRLQKQYASQCGSKFLYGTFRFIFHEGLFLGIEDWPRNRCYSSQSQTTKTRKKWK